MGEKNSNVNTKKYVHVNKKNIEILGKKISGKMIDFFKMPAKQTLYLIIR